MPEGVGMVIGQASRFKGFLEDAAHGVGRFPVFRLQPYGRKPVVFIGIFLFRLNGFEQIPQIARDQFGDGHHCLQPMMTESVF